MATDTSSSSSTKFNLSLDLRAVVVALLLVIAGMLAFWQPWNDPRADTRTIEVTGSATVKAVPDEFVFYPTYQFTNPSKAVALAKMTQKSEAIVAKLKALGVADEKIKTNLNGNDFPVYYSTSSGATYNLQITVTVGDKDLAGKVQNYLLMTTPRGSVTPNPTFSETKQNELESQARDKATKDARAKAEQSAKNLGFSLGSVKTVVDGVGFGVYDMMRGAPNAAVTEGRDSSSKLTIQPGENELNYTVTVTYFVR